MAAWWIYLAAGLGGLIPIVICMGIYCCFRPLKEEKEDYVASIGMSDLGPANHRFGTNNDQGRRSTNTWSSFSPEQRRGTQLAADYEVNVPNRPNHRSNPTNGQLTSNHLQGSNIKIKIPGPPLMTPGDRVKVNPAYESESPEHDDHLGHNAIKETSLNIPSTDETTSTKTSPESSVANPTYQDLAPIPKLTVQAADDDENEEDDGFTPLPADRARMSRFYDDEKKKDSDSSDSDEEEQKNWAKLRIRPASEYIPSHTEKAQDEEQLQKQIRHLSLNLDLGDQQANLDKMFFRARAMSNRKEYQDYISNSAFSVDSMPSESLNPSNLNPSTTTLLSFEEDDWAFSPGTSIDRLQPQHRAPNTSDPFSSSPSQSQSQSQSLSDPFLITPTHPSTSKTKKSVKYDEDDSFSPRSPLPTSDAANPKYDSSNFPPSLIEAIRIYLKEEDVQLSDPPYSNDDGSAGAVPIDWIEDISFKTDADSKLVVDAFEHLRLQAVDSSVRVRPKQLESSTDPDYRITMTNLDISIVVEDSEKATLNTSDDVFLPPVSRDDSSTDELKTLVLAPGDVVVDWGDVTTVDEDDLFAELDHLAASNHSFSNQSEVRETIVVIDQQQMKELETVEQAVDFDLEGAEY